MTEHDKIATKHWCIDAGNQSQLGMRNFLDLKKSIVRHETVMKANREYSVVCSGLRDTFGLRRTVCRHRLNLSMNIPRMANISSRQVGRMARSVERESLAESFATLGPLRVLLCDLCSSVFQK